MLACCSPAHTLAWAGERAKITPNPGKWDRPFAQRLLHWQAVEKAVLPSHTIGLQLRKIRVCLIDFIRAYVGRHGKIHSKAQTSIQKTIFFSRRPISEKKTTTFIFNSLQV